MERTVSKDWLYKELRGNGSRLIILDCRSSNEYGEYHIRQAVNFSIPTIMLRRLAAGKIDLISTIKSRELKEKIAGAYKDNIFVLYDENSERSEVISTLSKRLSQDGCDVVYLEDGFAQFRACYPEWCDSLDDSLTATDPELPLMGLRSLRISNYGPTNCVKGKEKCTCEIPCNPSGYIEDDTLVEILPHLFLGNAVNSEDLETLTKHNIKYVLNVTPNLPNVFEASGDIKYMKIPITDHWSQDLTAHFPKTIEFIDFFVLLLRRGLILREEASYYQNRFDILLAQFEGNRNGFPWIACECELLNFAITEEASRVEYWGWKPVPK
ncbi:unnamed protein product [Nesidiocoris tenuis]|uniref:protein-tyrosine-phosphatase n=1 Tax=Nesidiocoris tenuis TaxID=355587 RepID=A0A6H5G566_9HEMI|nr:unnamed protein product [Nesidiocoris tenuis]